MEGELKKALRHFFAQKNGERRRKSSLHAFMPIEAFYSKCTVFSSLPRRNNMKPGHLHQTPEALLACPPQPWRRWMKSLISFACEVLPYRRFMSQPYILRADILLKKFNKPVIIQKTDLSELLATAR